jgi:hypothetical protein
MIFGHLGLAFIFKAKFYKRSLILLILFSFLPDILFYVFFGIQWTIVMTYNPMFNGLLRWILNLTGTPVILVDDPSAPSHSIIVYVLFFSLILVLMTIGSRKKVVAGLIYGAILFSHILFDLLLPDANRGKAIVYPLYPFNQTPLEFYIMSDTLFWLIDLSIFVLGFFLYLWAFSKHEGRVEYDN